MEKAGAGIFLGLCHFVRWKGAWLFSDDGNKDMLLSWITHFWVLLLWKKGSLSSSKEKAVSNRSPQRRKEGHLGLNMEVSNALWKTGDEIASHQFWFLF